MITETIKIHKLIIILFMTLLSQHLYAQKSEFDPTTYLNDISYSQGIYDNMQNSDLNIQGLNYRLEYGRFDYNGLGGRVGINYFSDDSGNLNVIGLPLLFAWRTRLTDQREFEQRLNDAIETTINDSYNNRFSLINTLTSMLSWRLELNAGLTPGFSMGDGYRTVTTVNNNQTAFAGMRANNKFYLTADAGLRLTLRVWRFNLAFIPQYHYLITDNFRTINNNPQFNNHKVTKHIISANFGLSFML